ncbi:retrotransposon protein, putative, ty1-copia subclass [Tanacetum coccineum]
MPPFTLQHNGVSERRNQTLLDMVRSMMKLTNLPLSFWGYALESVARILNMGCDALVKCTTLAIKDSESKNCLEAMRAEMKSMKDNKVWDLIDLLPIEVWDLSLRRRKT